MLTAEKLAQLAPLTAQIVELNTKMMRLDEEIGDRERQRLDIAKKWGDIQEYAKQHILDRGELGAWQAGHLAKLTKRSKKTLELYHKIANNWSKIEKARKTNPNLSINQARTLTVKDAGAKPAKRSEERQELVELARECWSNPELSDDDRAHRIELFHIVCKFIRDNTEPQYKRTGCVQAHFLDSGAYSLKKQGYSVKATNEYRDQYGEFVTNRSSRGGIDHYANLDVIGDPQATWDNQHYLETVHKCHPVPVVHFGTDENLDWLAKYVDKGHAYIGLGGLVLDRKDPNRKELRAARHKWIAKCFELTAQRSASENPIQLHGFGVGTQPLMAAFPWHSVDTNNWNMYGGRGSVYVPAMEDGQFVFTKRPQVKRVSELLERIATTDVKSSDKMTYERLQEWLKMIEVPFAEYDEDAERWRGVRSPDDHESKRITNVHYLQRVADQYGIRIYFSGDGTRNCCPEVVFGDKANVMLTFYKLWGYNRDKGKLPARFRRLVRARRGGSGLS